MKALYYPNIDIEYRTTKTNLVVTNHPSLYLEPVSDRTIIHVDCTYCIPAVIQRIITKSMAKEEFIQNYGLFKLLLEGNVDNDTYRRAVESLCMKSQAFSYFLLYISEFGDRALTPIVKTIQPLRLGIDTMLSSTKVLLNSLPKSKFCMQTHDQIFYSIPYGGRVDQLDLWHEYIEPMRG